MKYYMLFTVLIALTGCKETPRQHRILSDTLNSEQVRTEVPHPGKRIMEQECNICHNPTISRARRIAPPMESIKRHYIDANTTKGEFTEALIRWVNDPRTESKMLGAHAKFGPMPYMPNPDDAVAQIADYLYDNEIDRPEEFDFYFAKAHPNGVGEGECDCFDDLALEKEYAAIGLAHAMAAQNELGRNLKRAIQEKGTIGAIEFCNTEASKLTDSISVMRNAIVERVSDKPRNPANQANAEELRSLASFKQMISSKRDIEPVVQIEDDRVRVYYPIMTNALCLQCHGNPDTQVRPETLSALKNLYPKDKAVGYDLDEIRGLWSVDFNVND